MIYLELLLLLLGGLDFEGKGFEDFEVKGLGDGTGSGILLLLSFGLSSCCTTMGISVGAMVVGLQLPK